MVTKGQNKGEKRYNVVCPKQRKNWVAKPINEKKSFGYIDGMMESVIKLGEGEIIDYRPAIQKRCIASTPKPLKQDVIDKHKSRLFK